MKDQQNAKITIFILLYAFLAFSPPDLIAQRRSSGNVTGVVFDEQQLPLPGVSVYLQAQGELIGGVTTIDGKFLLTNIPEGFQELILKFMGYEDQILKVKISKGKTLELEAINLRPSSHMLDGVVVVGRVNGIVRSLNVQKNSDNIVNVISVEQTSKFPDSNIGDALKRVPGLTIQTDQGEARRVNVRGLGAGATTILINGDRISATSSNSRIVEVDLIPADVIQSIEVSKSASADLDGEATGGVVNLVTRAAYSRDLQLSGNLSYGHNTSWDDRISYNTALGASKKFLDGKLGVALNGSLNSRSYQSDNMQADWKFYDTGVEDDSRDNTRYLYELLKMKYWLRRDRKNINIGLDYELSKTSIVGVKISYSKRDDYENRYRTKISSIDFPTSYTEENVGISEGTITTYTKAGTSGEGANFLGKKPKNYRLDEKNVQNYQLFGEHLIGKLETDWSVSYSRAKKLREMREMGYRVYEGDATFFVEVVDPRKPQVTFDITDFEEKAEFYRLSENIQRLKDDSYKAKINAKYPFKNGYVKAGMVYRRVDHEEDNQRYIITPRLNTMDQLSKIPTENYASNGLEGELSNYYLLPSPSREFVGGLALDDPLAFKRKEDVEYHFDTSYGSMESVTASYLQSKYNFNKKLSLRAGVRYEFTDATYDATAYDDLSDEVIPIQGKNSYGNLLPSADLKYKLNDQIVLRGAYSKTINRPRYSRVVPRISFRENDGGPNEDLDVVKMGNPKLKPRTSHNLDVSFEHYQKEGGLLSVGFFYKKLNDFIGTVSSLVPLSNGDNLEVIIRENVGDGMVKGMELAVQRDLDFLPSIFKNLSFYGNMTILDSELNDFSTGYDLSNGQGTTRKLAETADFTYNLSLSYKTDKFTLTGAVNSTSEYVDYYGSTPDLDIYYDKQTFVDFNGSYNLTKQWMLFAEAKNVMNEPLRYYVGEKDYVYEVEYYGSQYVFGVKYKL